jgi:hypothetical protein
VKCPIVVIDVKGNHRFFSIHALHFANIKYRVY